MFKVLFFVEDCVVDLFLFKIGDVLCFFYDLGCLFNYLWMKILRLGDVNVFVFKRGFNLIICFVRGFELYFDVCRFLIIKLCLGFLFCFVIKFGNILLSIWILKWLRLD